MLTPGCRWDDPEETPERVAEGVIAYAQRCYEQWGYAGPPRFYVNADQSEALRRVSGYEVVVL
jgi:hypothetical protein